MLVVSRYRTNSKLLTNCCKFYSTCDAPWPELPKCNFHPEKFSGDKKQMLSQRQKYLNPALMSYYSQPLLLHRGHMQWLWDVDQKRYLDLFGGIVTVSVGHCHPEVNAAAKRQMDQLWHTTNIYYNPTINQYAEKLTEKFPGDLKVVYFVNSGSEANDLAIHMSRLYTKNWTVLSHRNGYHGASPYLMGVTALSTWRYNVPTGFGCINTCNPDPYQGPWGGAHCRDSVAQTDRQCSCSNESCHAEDMYIDQLEDTLRYSTSQKDSLACFIVESIQGVGGSVQYPKKYLKRAFEIVKSRGGLFIADEVQTGFGRTGDHYWGFQNHGVMPDIVTIAKGIGNGYPMAAVVTTRQIASVLTSALHFNTFGGNPVAGAVGSAVLDVIDRENMQSNSKVLGDVLLEGLSTLKNKHPNIGDVRGKGLMLGIEMVKDKNSRTPLEPSKMLKVWEHLRDRNILIGKGGIFGNVFRIKPPMCITNNDANYFLEVFDRVLDENKAVLAAEQ